MDNETRENRPWQDWAAPLLCLAGALVILAAYACQLNDSFYRAYGPFFDSASYTNKLAEDWGVAHTQGLAVGLRHAMDGTTAPLPGILTVLLMKAGVLPERISRHTPVALQASWLLILASAVFYYLYVRRRFPPWMAAGACAPFFMFSEIFFFNGGLSDFRLDLTLYIFVALTLVFYLIAEDSGSWMSWVAAGCAAGVASLMRATTPVYLTIMLAPVLLVQLWNSRRRARYLANVAVMVGVCALVAAGLFVRNFEQLYYYYVIWNADANAHLPLSVSQRHFGIGFSHVGVALLATSVIFGIVTVAGGPTRKPWSLIRSMDWKLLYWGLAPLGFLALRGAGLNPFVSMPAVFGILMFCLTPLKGPVRAPGGLLRTGALTLVLLACGWNAATAVNRHVPPYGAEMAGLKQSVEAMRANAKLKGLHEVRFASTHIWNFQSAYLRNVLIYEFRGDALGAFVQDQEGVRWYSPDESQFGAAVPVIWKEIRGDSDAAKIETLLNLARKDLDFVFFPNPETIDHLEREMAHNYVNLKVRQIRERFLQSGEWEPVGGLIRIAETEHVQLYAKRLER